jgi:hypothetical protein
VNSARAAWHAKHVVSARAAISRRPQRSSIKREDNSCSCGDGAALLTTGSHLGCSYTAARSQHTLARHLGDPAPCYAIQRVAELSRILAGRTRATLPQCRLGMLTSRPALHWERSRQEGAYARRTPPFRRGAMQKDSSRCGAKLRSLRARHRDRGATGRGLPATLGSKPPTPEAEVCSV